MTAKWQYKVHAIPGRRGKTSGLRKQWSLGFLLFFLLTSPANANVGLPMIVPYGSLVLILFVPIVLLEAFVLKKILELKCGNALWLSALANAITTLFGIPLTWTLLLFVSENLQEITPLNDLFISSDDSPIMQILKLIIQMPWMWPQTGWWYMFGFLILLVPFFFSSWIIESLFVHIKIGRTFSVARKACLIANLASHLLMVLVVIGLAFFGVGKSTT